MPAPTTRRDDTTDSYHGTPVSDPYRWLEDPHTDEVARWVQEQNAHTEAYLETCASRGAIRGRLTHLWDYERVGVPVRRGDLLFFMANDGLQEQSVLCVQPEDGSEPPRVLLDPNELSEDGTVALASWSASKDGTMLAWATSDGGSDWHTWRVRDVQSATDRDDLVEWSKFSGAAWAPDASGFFYSRYDAPTDPLEQVNDNQKLYFHRLGTSQDDDTCVHARPDQPSWGFSPQVVEGVGIVSVWRGTEPVNLVYRFDPLDPDAGVVPLIDEWRASYTLVGVVDGHLYLLTDHDAPRQRIVRLDLATAGASLEEVVPQGEHLLETARIVGRRLVLTRLVRAYTTVEVARLDGDIQCTVPLPGIGTAGGFSGDVHDPLAYFWFTSFTRPTTVFTYDVHTQERTVFREPSVDFDPAEYTTEQVVVTSADGTLVPMFLSYRTDLVRDGRSPTVLYGYGGFNIPITPTFSPKTIVWMDMGGVWASANLRGGGEFGRDWHAAGTRERKQNVFDDFIACGEWLIANGWTEPSRLAIQGRSNGGLLVGATVLQRPDLFGAALPGVGVLDMLRYHRFTIGWAWASDYGTSDEADMFPHLLAYSPVHNARPGDYPAIMVMTADHDDRVVPAHSFKFTAAMQHAQQGPAPILARIETRAGHGAGKSLSMVIDEATDEKAFLVQALRMDGERFRF